MIRCHDFINGEYYEDYWTGERIYGFLLCTVKGKGTLYTKEEFRKKFLD